MRRGKQKENEREPESKDKDRRDAERPTNVGGGIASNTDAQ